MAPTPAAIAEAELSGTSESLTTDFDPGPQAASLGATDAPVVVVEFVDYRCGFCARQARAAFDEVRTRYIDKGLVRYFAVEVPLLGPGAVRDAIVARCAGAQGRYWAVHRALLIDPEFPGEERTNLERLARATGLDPERLTACVASGEQQMPLDEGMARALAHRVDATPVFFFGYPVPGTHSMTIERHLVGAVGMAPVVDAIDALLSSLRMRQQSLRTDR